MFFTRLLVRRQFYPFIFVEFEFALRAHWAFFGILAFRECF